MGDPRYSLENTARKRAQRALSEKEALFRTEHAQDTDEELCGYIFICAQRIGHSPAACEVIGGEYISERFGIWEKALKAAGLTPAAQTPRYERRLIFRQELEFQKQAFLEEKRVIREAKEKRGRKDSVVLAQEQEEVLRLEEQFLQKHSTDSDEQLLVYLRQCAAELGRTPHKKEVIGSELLKERFITWAVALHMAGLELPKDMKPPKERDLSAYRKAKKMRAKQSAQA